MHEIGHACRLVRQQQMESGGVTPRPHATT